MQAPMARAAAARLALLLALLLVFTPAPSHAGCRKRRATNVAPDELVFNHQPLEQEMSLEELPDNWDWNNVDGSGRSMLVSSWNQHIPQYCGSCWLHGSSSMIQDRLKILKGGLGPDTMLARQVVLNCGAFHGYGEGCNGGDVIDVVRYMKNFGLPDESCQPYSATDHTKYGKHAKRCPASAYCINCMPIKDKDTCWAVHTPPRYFLSSYGKLDGPGEVKMMNEIFQRGPITCSMATPEVFDYGYNRGVAIDASNSTDVDHDVEVVGWGVEEGTGLKYWRIRNSWGTYWGEMGFFKAQRGVNAFQLELGDCWYAVPTWQDEQDVRAGRKVGSMWGLLDPEEAAHVVPEGHRHPHFDDGRKPGAGGASDDVRDDVGEKTADDGDNSSGSTPEDTRPAITAAAARDAAAQLAQQARRIRREAELLQQAARAQLGQQGQQQGMEEREASLRVQPFGGRKGGASGAGAQV